MTERRKISRISTPTTDCTFFNYREITVKYITLKNRQYQLQEEVYQMRKRLDKLEKRPTWRDYFSLIVCIGLGVALGIASRII